MTDPKVFPIPNPLQSDDPNNEPSTTRSIRQVCFDAFSRGQRPMGVVRQMGFKRSTVLTYYHQFSDTYYKAPDKYDFLDHLSRMTRFPSESLHNQFQEAIDRIFGKDPVSSPTAADEKANAILMELTMNLGLGCALDLSPFEITWHLRRQGWNWSRLQWLAHSYQAPGPSETFHMNDEAVAQKKAVMVLDVITKVLALCWAFNQSSSRTLAMLSKAGIETAKCRSSAEVRIRETKKNGVACYDQAICTKAGDLSSITSASGIPSFRFRV